MFPIYRKSKSLNNYYKVISKDFMIEISKLGNSYSIYEINAKILPDRNLISDIILNENEFLDNISESEFNDFEMLCTKSLTRNKF